MAGSETEATVMLNVVPGLNTGITAFNAGLSSINAQFQNVTDTVYNTFGVLDAMVLSSGAVLAQFGLGAANAFGEFEQGMKIVQAVSQQSGEAIGYLKQQAQEFSIQYRTDIDSITEGLQTLGRAGLNSASEQTEVLENGLQTAKLEGRELNGVLEEIIQNTALLGGDINSDTFGEQSGYLNDLLVGTSLSAPLDTHDISETLKYSGGMLAAAGGTIATEEGGVNEAGRELVEDYMGAVALFAQKGVKGSIAGTALRAFFNKPATQDKSVVDALSEIGMAPEDLWNDEETMKPVSEQIGLIQRQMEAKNISKMDQMQIWSKIVGGKMGQQMMKLDSQDIREMTSEIQQASSAETLANQTFDTYNQKVTQLHEQTQKLFRDFGQHIVVALKPAVEIVSKIVDLLNNPMLQGVSFVAFIGFVATLSHALQAALRVLQRLKAELGGVLFGGTDVLPASKYQGLLRTGHQIPTKWDSMSFGDKSFDLPESKYKGQHIPSKFDDKGHWTFQDVDRASSKKQEKIEQTKKVKQDYFNTVKQNISEINASITDMMVNIQEQFNNLDINVDVNLDDIKMDVQEIGSTATTVINEIGSQAKITLASIRAELAAMKESDVIGTGLGLRPSPLALNNQSILDFMKQLPPESRELLNRQLRDGTLNVLDLFHTGTTGFEDPFYKDRNRNMSPFDGRQSYFAQERKGNFTMFPHQITQEEMDIARQFMNYPTMDDFIKFQIMMKEAFPDMPHQWVIDPETGGYVNLREHEWTDKDRNKPLVSEEEANKQLEPFFADAKAKEQGVQLINSYFEQLRILQEEAFAEAQASKVAFSSAVPGVMPQEALDYEYGGPIPTNYNDYARMEREARIRHGLEVAETSHAVPGVGIPEEAQKALDDYEKSLQREFEAKSYSDYVNERQKKGLETLGFSANVPGVIPQEYLDNISADDFTKYTHPTWSSRLGDNKYLGSLFGKDSRLSKGVDALEKGANKTSEGFDNLAKKLGSSSTSKLGKAVDMLGGPFSVAIMGATAAMELYNYMFGQWQKSVQEHQQKISEAENKVSEAEDNIRKAYQEANPNATQAEINKAVDEAYVSIADNNYSMSGLDENTQALYVATSQLQRANDLLEQDAMDDNFGIGGTYTKISNGLSGMFDLMTGNTGSVIVLDTGANSDLWSTFGTNVHQGSILDNNANAVLTGSQSSADYVYSKENAAIFAADVWDAMDSGLDVLDTESGRVKNIRGLDNFFGSDSQHFKEVTQGIFKGDGTFGGSAYDNMVSMIANNFRDEGEQHKLQMALKNYQKDFQVVGKQMRKFEKANKGRTALSEFGKKGVSSAKALKNLEVKDKDLYRYIKSLSIKTGLSEQKILMAAQLQQMQDLNQIMVDQLQPQVMGIATNAYQQLSASLSTNQKTGSAASGANSTAVSAAAIAAKLSVLVEEALDKEMQSDYISRGGTDESIINDPSGQVLKSKVVAAWNKTESQRTEWEKFLVDHYGKNYLQSEYLSGWDLAHPDATEAQRKAAMDNYWKNVSKYDTYQGAINATRTGANAYYTGALLDAYDASSIGEQEGSPSGASGGSGSGDKDKDKDKGTKKERVDLVLCNKKEIPKLNVNLFKKAPQFTILNKNFKLRDIKINTQDKPKAVLDSIKNAIIDTQRRMDPKIIQDENAEYDPVAATDGNPTPRGSTSTTTD